MFDKESKISFLVDSGAQVSLLPAMSGVKRSSPGKFILRSANGSLIHTYGENSLEPNLGLCRTYAHIFIVADVGCTILGVDFLRNFELVVDLHSRCLRNQDTLLKAKSG